VGLSLCLPPIRVCKSFVYTFDSLECGWGVSACRPYGLQGVDVFG
jgi:hypothetical protein